MTQQSVKLSIVVGVHNQEHKVGEVLSALVERMDVEYAGQYELIIVDQASTDNSQASIVAFTNHHPAGRLNHIDLASDGLSLKRGLVCSIASQLVWCRLQDCSFDTVQALLKALEGADIVLCQPKAQDSHATLSRMKGIALKVAKKLMSMTPDQLSAPKAFKVGAVSALCNEIDARQSEFCYELLLRARKMALSIAEIALPLSPKWPALSQLLSVSKGLVHAQINARIK